MPYTIKKNNKGKFCVHKSDADGKPMGKPIGKCHANAKKAGAQISAIERSEKKSVTTSAVNLYIAPAVTEGIADWDNSKIEYSASSSIDGNIEWWILNDSGALIKRGFEANDFVFADEREFPVLLPADVADAADFWDENYNGSKTLEQFKGSLIALAERKGEDFVEALPEKWKKEMKQSAKDLIAKAESIDEFRSKVINAWDASYEYSLWPFELFDEYLVIYDSKAKSHFKVGYIVTNDEVNFDARNKWVEVKLKKEWLEKALSLRGSYSFEDLIADEGDDPESEIDSRYAIKALGKNRVGSYGILWGDEESKDLHTEFFDADETRDIKSIFDAVGVVPFIVHHAQDDEVVKFVVGSVDVMEFDDVGVWWEAKIKEFETYKEYVKPLLDRKALFSSTGTLPAAKRTTKTGKITRWPVAEISGTWTPAEYRMLEVPITEIKSVYSELGLDTGFISEFVDEDEPENQETPDTSGAEKARLKALIGNTLVNLKLLELEN